MKIFYIVATLQFLFIVSANAFPWQWFKTGVLKRPKRAAGFPVTFDEGQQTTFVNKHNEFRRAVNPEASNMIELVWDSDLAQSARNYSSECIYGHSGPGENIHRGYALPADIPTLATTLWHDEVAFYTYSNNSCQTDQICGHYTQVVWGTTEKFGCGTSFCQALMDNGDTGYLTVCHYNPVGNTQTLLPGSITVLDQPYKNGTSCSECPSNYICVDKLCRAPTTETTTTTTTMATTMATTETTETTTTMATTETTASTMATAETTTTTASTTETTKAVSTAVNMPSTASVDITAIAESSTLNSSSVDIHHRSHGGKFLMQTLSACAIFIISILTLM